MNAPIHNDLFALDWPVQYGVPPYVSVPTYSLHLWPEDAQKRFERKVVRRYWWSRDANVKKTSLHILTNVFVILSTCSRIPRSVIVNPDDLADSIRIDRKDSLNGHHRNLIPSFEWTVALGLLFREVNERDGDRPDPRGVIVQMYSELFVIPGRIADRQSSWQRMFPRWFRPGRISHEWPLK